MNRRGFIGALAGLAGLPLVSKLLPKGKAEEVIPAGSLVKGELLDGDKVRVVGFDDSTGLSHDWSTPYPYKTFSSSIQLSPGQGPAIRRIERAVKQKEAEWKSFMEDSIFG